MENLKDYLERCSDDIELNTIINLVAETGKSISDKIKTAPLNDIYGSANSTNASNDEQQKLDQIAEDEFLSSIQTLKSISLYVSEEKADAVKISDSGKYVFFTDPLDGSSNIDVNVGVGTIFGVSKSENKYLVKGSELISAGYILYGPATILALTIGQGVSFFTLDNNNEFRLSSEKVEMPESGGVYSINEGYSHLYDQSINNYLQTVKTSGKKLRYIGSMVADIHRTLIKGGIFMFPEDSKHPNGKLRLMYEVNPISMLVEQAGGKAISGMINALEIKPEGTHQRVSIVMGSARDVEEYVELISE